MTAIPPSQATSLEGSSIPEEVIEVFNRLILKNFRYGHAIVKISEARGALEHFQGFNDSWLDVEPVFRRAGWGVHYDKPGYNETYEGFYDFTAK